MRTPRLLIFAVILAGCGGPEGRMKLYPVRGKVLVDGRPATGMDVVLYPDTALADKNADFPRAVVMEDGTFLISTYEAGDGAPAGTYKVSILSGGDPASSEDIQFKKPKPRTGIERYRDPTSSGLALTVKQQSNEIAPFELTSQAPRPSVESTRRPPSGRR